MTHFNERWGWYRLNGIYYVYDRELQCIPACTTEEYLDTTNKAKMLEHLTELNQKEV